MERKCAICEGTIGPQCFGGCWSIDVARALDGEIPWHAVRESCSLCSQIDPPTDPASLERRRAWNEARGGVAREALKG